MCENFVKTYDRVEQLRKKLHLNKGEVCDLLGIGRTMLHYLKTEERNLSPKAYRKLEEEEDKAGIRVILSPFDPPPEEVEIFIQESAEQRSSSKNYKKLYLEQKARADRLEKDIEKIRKIIN